MAKNTCGKRNSFTGVSKQDMKNKEAKKSDIKTEIRATQ